MADKFDEDIEEIPLQSHDYDLDDETDVDREDRLYQQEEDIVDGEEEKDEEDEVVVEKEEKDEEEDEKDEEEEEEVECEAVRKVRLHREKLDKQVQENKSVTLDTLSSYVTNYTKLFALPTPDGETMQMITDSLLAQKCWTDNDGEMHWNNTVVDPLLSVLIAVQ